MDKLKSMQVFVRVVEAGSFSAAAPELDLTPQMVAKHIASLEDLLRVRLINRTTRRQNLTALGREYYERCRAILADVSAAEHFATRSRATPEGRLRITAPNTFGAAMAPMLNLYQSRYPNVELDLMLTDRFVDLIGEGFEIGFRIGADKPEGLDSTILAPFRLAIAAAPSYLASRGTPATPDDLRDHECLEYVFPTSVSWREWRFFQNGRTIRVPVKGRFRINDARAMVAAGVEGMGIVLAGADLLSGPISSGLLVPLLPDYGLPQRPMYLVYPTDRRPTAKLTSFIAAAIEAFPPAL